MYTHTAHPKTYNIYLLSLLVSQVKIRYTQQLLKTTQYTYVCYESKRKSSLSESHRPPGWQIMCWADVKLSSAQPRIRRLFLTSMPCGENSWACTISPGLVKNYSLPAQVSGNNYGTLVYTVRAHSFSFSSSVFSTTTSSSSSVPTSVTPPHLVSPLK